MLGAVIGDIAGSRFELNNIKSKDFDFLTYRCFITDDSIMTLAVAEAILRSRLDFSDLSDRTVESMRKLASNYPDAGYGEMFRRWLHSEKPAPYGSFGNGAAMRVSPAGFAARSLEEAKLLARRITEVTHSHPEGLKGAEAVAVAVYLARSRVSILEIRDFIHQNYYP